MVQNKVQGIDLPGAEVLLKQAYVSFNKRDINAVLSLMQPDVDWPNGMEGGYEHGHAAVRDYWTRQWAILNPNVEPVAFNEEDGKVDVTVHQVVHDSAGKLLVDQIIHHIYTFENGLVKTMEIREQ